MSPKKIFIAGHRGMVGSAILEALLKEGNKLELITASRDELDLCQQKAVQSFFKKHKPDQVYIAAAKVGGIHANNSMPAEFIYQNLMIEANLIHSAHQEGVDKILFLGSSCIYPKFADQPIREEALLTGALEPTNEPYAIAKIAGIKLCESYNRQYGRDYRSLMPTNLYGPRDNFHPEHSHVVPALIRRFHEAKMKKQSTVSIWGSGQVYREFLFVEDLAKAAIHVMNLPKKQLEEVTHPMCSHINAGYGSDVSILELAHLVAEVTGFEGEIRTDPSKPDGTPKKLLDSGKLQKLGWKPEVDLEEGLQRTYEWFKNER